MYRGFYEKGQKKEKMTIQAQEDYFCCKKHTVKNVCTNFIKCLEDQALRSVSIEQDDLELTSVSCWPLGDSGEHSALNTFTELRLTPVFSRGRGMKKSIHKYTHTLRLMAQQ